MPDGQNPELWNMLLVTHGPFIGAGLIYFIWWIAPGGGKAQQIAAEREKLAMQLASEERREATRSEGIKSLAASMDKHTEMDDRRFSELVHGNNRLIHMVREMPEPIGGLTRMVDDMAHGIEREKNHG